MIREEGETKVLLVMGQDEELTPNMPRPEGAEIVSVNQRLKGRRYDVVYYPENEVSDFMLKGIENTLRVDTGKKIPYNSSLNTPSDLL